MNTKYLSAFLVTGTIALGNAPAIADSANAPQLNFACKINQGVPTTVVQAEGSDVTQPIFHWKKEALASQSLSGTPQQFCDRVTAKLADYSAQGYELSNISFVGSEEARLPAICVNTTKSNECSKILTTLSPVKDRLPNIVAGDIVTAILDPSLQEDKTIFRDRGVQATSYQVNFWDLFGFGPTKSVGKFNLR